MAATDTAIDSRFNT